MIPMWGPLTLVNLRNILRYFCVLVPVLLFCMTACTDVQEKASPTPKDSRRMRKEAEEYAKQLETALDGTEQGKERFGLAVEKLYDLGRIATPAVLSVIISNKVDPEVRMVATEIVTDLRDVRALHPLVAVARNVTNPKGVRHTVAWRIGFIGTSQALDSLLAFLNSEDPILKSAATYGIRAASNHMGVGKAFGPVVDMIQDTGDQDLRKGAVAALSAFGDKGVPLLSELLGDDSKSVRGVARAALGQTRSHAAVKPLIGLLSSEDGDTRIKAIMALECLGDTSAVPVLIEMLEYEGDEASVAAIALGTIGDPRGLDALEKQISKARTEGVQPNFYMLKAYEKIKKHQK